MTTQSAKAVLAVLSYSAQFDHPLTSGEIMQRLLTEKGLRLVDRDLKSAAPLKAGEIDQALLALINSQKIINQNNFFTVANRTRAFTKRRTSQIIAREKAPVIDELVSLVARAPWVLGVTITGSHAVAGTRQDDLDFLVITKKNRLWLARLWLLFQSVRLGRRPQLPNGNLSYSWDLNFWLDETRLALPAGKRTVYEAYEILQTNWVFERHQIRQRFIAANPWVKKFLQTWRLPNKKQLSNLESPQRNSTPGSLLLTWLDWLAMLVQVGYRTLRHGRQRADLHSAFFHPTKTRARIFNNWQKIYSASL
jgi:hypothetical protein